MKKSFIGLAVLGAFAGAASAQTSVSIYGLVDAGVVSERGGPQGNVTKLTSGIQNGSRLGFRGMEDLGGGLSAKFVLESGFEVDTGRIGQQGPPLDPATGNTNRLFSRQAYVGLGGNWGNVFLGRQYTPHYLALAEVDPFSAGLAGDATNLVTTIQRMDNTIKYTTPTWSGFVGELAYGVGEQPDDTSANQQYGLSVGYANGPLLVKFAHHTADNMLGTDDTKNTLLVGKWDFGIAAASAGYNQTKGFGDIDTRDWMLGVSVPFGASTILASWIKKDDRNANNDADQWAIGYTYALSKRTNFYASYASISNDNAAAYTVGNATESGSGDKAFNVGIRHSF